MTTKYQRLLNRWKRKIAKKGVWVEYLERRPELVGQPINEDTRVEKKFRLQVLFTDELQGRDGGDVTPSDNAECVMAGDAVIEPKAGDQITTPAGKAYPIDSVRKLMPDGIPLRYILRLDDG